MTGSYVYTFIVRLKVIIKWSFYINIRYGTDYTVWIRPSVKIKSYTSLKSTKFEISTINDQI